RSTAGGGLFRRGDRPAAHVGRDGLSRVPPWPAGSGQILRHRIRSIELSLAGLAIAAALVERERVQAGLEADAGMAGGPDGVLGMVKKLRADAGASVRRRDVESRDAVSVDLHPADGYRVHRDHYVVVGQRKGDAVGGDLRSPCIALLRRQRGRGQGENRAAAYRRERFLVARRGSPDLHLGFISWAGRSPTRPPESSR